MSFIVLLEPELSLCFKDEYECAENHGASHVGVGICFVCNNDVYESVVITSIKSASTSWACEGAFGIPMDQSACCCWW